MQILQPYHTGLGEIDPDKLALQFSFKFNRVGDEQMEVFTKFEYSYPDPDENLFTLLNYEATFYLLIKDLENALADEKIKPIVDLTIIQLVYSTLRGMIAIRTIGTKIENFPIPVIDPSKLLQSISEEPDMKEGVPDQSEPVNQ